MNMATKAPPRRKKIAERTKLPTKPLVKKRSYPDVLELRKQCGAIVGKKQISRQQMADLAHASPGSIYNWERGLEPSRVHIDKLNQIASQLKAGTFTKQIITGKPTENKAHAIAKPGTKPSGPKSSKNGTRAPKPIVEIFGDMAPTYANHVVVIKGNGQDRLKFAVVPPGETKGRLLIDLVVPSDIISQIAHKN